MKTSSWDKSLETGNELIDSQHKELIQFVDELRVAEPGSDDEILHMLDRIMEITFIHFMSEENLMKQVNYPMDAEKAMVEHHREFKSYARLRVLEFRQGEMLSFQPLLTFLEDFLKVHEFEIDRLLADWIRERNKSDIA